MIDAHAHVFLTAKDDSHRPVDELATADRSAPIEEFERISGPAGVTGAVLVPLGNDDDYVATVVRQRRDRYRMIAVANPEVTDVQAVSDRLDRAGADGLRWFGLPDLSSGSPWWKMLAMLEDRHAMLWLYLGHGDIVMALDVANRFTGLPIVLNHSALPVSAMRVDVHRRPALECDVKGRAAAIAPLCAKENVWVVVSGQYAFARDEYPYPSIGGYLNELGQMIGYDRFVWGSDFPWITNVPGYSAEMELPRRELVGASKNEMNAIYAANAKRLTGLP